MRDMDRISDDIETMVWIDGKGRPRITQSIKSEKVVEFEIMEKVSEKRLEWLLGGLDLDVWNMPEHIRKNFTSFLVELRERRAAEKDYRKALDAAKLENMRGYANEIDAATGRENH
jgi:hypothetical protein